MALDPFEFHEKLPAILGRINPITSQVNLHIAAVENLETAVQEIAGDTGPDIILLFENGLI